MDSGETMERMRLNRSARTVALRLPRGGDGAVRGEMEDEGILLEGLRRGDARCFEEIVRRHGGTMLAVARRFLPDEDAARDAVQDAFLNAFRAMGRFRGDSRLSTWLHRVVVNAALMKLRSGRRRPETPIDDLLPRFFEDGHQAEPAREWPVSAETLLERRETRALVRRCIAQLPEAYRLVLQLRDIEDLDTAETAAALGTSPAAVKVRLHRARQALRTLLERELVRA